MNHPMNDSSTESAIWLDLVGANQGWLKRCRAAASGNPTALAELTDDNSPAARALHAGVTRTAPAPTGDPLAPLVSYDWQVAVAMRSLTLALAGQLHPREGVDAIIRLADQANLASGADTPPTSGPADTTDEDAYPAGIDHAVTGVMREIRSRRHDQARPFIELLALDLTGNFPTTVVDTITVPVVFAGDTRDAFGPGATGVGATGKLTLELLSSGPPGGLHPNPGNMCFLRADSGFTASIGQAWARAPTRLKPACITWTLRLGTDAAQPVTSIIGGSLAAAVAVGTQRTQRTQTDPAQPPTTLPRPPLHDYRRHRRPERSARRSHGTRPKGSGRLPRETPFSRSRVTTSTTRNRPPMATRSKYVAPLPSTTPPSSPAATSTAASDTTIPGTIALSALILGVGATALGVTNQRHAAQQAAAQRVIESEQLADRSADLLRTNPQLAALTALAAYQTSPTPQTTTAMATAISYNPNNAQVKDIPKSHSAAIGRTAAWLSTDDGIVAYSLTTMQPINEPMPTTDDNGRSESVELTLSRKGDRRAAQGSRNHYRQQHRPAKSPCQGFIGASSGRAY